jgi:multidrug resistance efflux pump
MPAMRSFRTEKELAEAKVRWYRSERLFRCACGIHEGADASKLRYEGWKFEALARQEQETVAEKELEQAQRQFQRHEIRSRVSGVIVSIRKQPGQGVQALEGVLRIRVAD